MRIAREGLIVLRLTLLAAVAPAPAAGQHVQATNDTPRHGHPVRGAVAGFVVGSVAGYVIGRSAARHRSSDSGEWIGPVAGASAGALVGGIIGALIRTERRVAVYGTPVQVGVEAAGHGVRFDIAVPVRLMR